MSTIQDRQIAQIGKFSKARPAAPRQVQLSGSKLTWVEPQDTRYITHYNVRVGSDASAPSYKVPVGSNSCVLAAGDTNFWVSAANDGMGTESPKAHVSGTATGGASAGSFLGAPSSLSASAALTETDGILRLTISGLLPIDSNLAGLRFIVERPLAVDPFPATFSLPGQIDNSVPVWYSAGDGSAFTQTFDVVKPTRAEKWIVYALPFSEGYENPLVRLSSWSPVAPANVTAYAAVDITTSLTVAGSELTDVTATGTPVITPTGFGSLRIDSQYVPPYLAGPEVSIGDFQGVTVWYIAPDGEVQNLGDQPYLPAVAYDAAPPDNLGNWSATVPTPNVGESMTFELCAYSSTKHLPFRKLDVAPAQIIVSVSVSSGNISGGYATQVSGFNVTVSSPALSGGANSGIRTQHYTYIFTPPVDEKWAAVNIWRFQSDGPPNWNKIDGGAQEVVAPAITVSPQNSGDWPMPGSTEHWIFEARSLNLEGKENTISAPRVFVTLTPTGELLNANNSIADAMLQDLSVQARALADAAVTSSKYAPASIGAAAIGIAAINDAHIANCNVDKLTGNSMSISGTLTIGASGAIQLNGYSGAAAVNIDTFGIHAGGFYGDVAADNIAAATGSVVTFHSAFDFASSSDAQSVGDLLLSNVGAASGTPTYFFIKNGLGVGYHTMDLTDILNAMSLFIGAGTSGKYLQNNGSNVLWADPLASGLSATLTLSSVTSLTFTNGVLTGYL